MIFSLNFFKSVVNRKEPEPEFLISVSVPALGGNLILSAPAPQHCAKLSPLQTVIRYQPSDKKMEEASQR
jgi:hypothetical protein